MAKNVSTQQRTKQGVIIFNQRLGEYEFWFQSLPLCHSVLQDKVEDWANHHGYAFLVQRSTTTKKGK